MLAHYCVVLLFLSSLTLLHLVAARNINTRAVIYDDGTGGSFNTYGTDTGTAQILIQDTGNFVRAGDLTGQTVTLDSGYGTSGGNFGFVRSLPTMDVNQGYGSFGTTGGGMVRSMQAVGQPSYVNVGNMVRTYPSVSSSSGYGTIGTGSTGMVRSLPMSSSFPISSTTGYGSVGNVGGMVRSYPVDNTQYVQSYPIDQTSSSMVRSYPMTSGYGTTANIGAGGGGGLVRSFSVDPVINTGGMTMDTGYGTATTGISSTGGGMVRSMPVNNPIYTNSYGQFATTSTGVGGAGGGVGQRSGFVQSYPTMMNPYVRMGNPTGMNYVQTGGGYGTTAVRSVSSTGY